MDLSPFTHLPQPGGAVRIAPLVVLTVVAAALAAAGLVGLERRDLG
jgi:ABC-2 type transport system permease protein